MAKKTLEQKAREMAAAESKKLGTKLYLTIDGNNLITTKEKSVWSIACFKNGNEIAV